MITLDAARKQLRMLSTIFIHKAKVMYKIANNTAPIYLTDLFQMRGNESNLNNSQLNLRSTSNKNFLIPKPALVWNSVPLEIKQFSTIESFTNNCFRWMKCDSAYYKEYLYHHCKTISHFV